MSFPELYKKQSLWWWYFITFVRFMMCYFVRGGKQDNNVYQYTCKNNVNFLLKFSEEFL